MLPTYPLQALLSVRLFREDAAKNEVRAAERRALEARQETDRRLQVLEEYRAWWPAEVDRRYDAVIHDGQSGQGMNPEALDAFRAGLAALADGELVREAAVAEAREAEKAAAAAVAAAREAVARARREAAKIEAHRDIWNEQARKEAERQEDRELEEFHAPEPVAEE